MLEAGEFARALIASGFGFATGVPCSRFAPLVAELSRSQALPYHAAASEGEAVAMAAGAALGSRLGVVLMQNSGLGDALNPLASLVLPYQLPLLVLLSHRGDTPADEPHHRAMGKITRPLLDLLGIECHDLPAEGEAAARLVTAVAARIAAHGSVGVLVVAKRTFAPGAAADPGTQALARSGALPGTAPAASGELPRRDQVLEALAQSLEPHDLCVATTGMTARELYAVGDRAASFYMMGSMGCAAPLGLGVALVRPRRRVVVIDGDGALLMKLGALATIAHHRPPGLMHVVLDNSSYDSTGGQATAACRTDFVAMARAAGYAGATAAASLDELVAALKSFRVGEGPGFVCLAIAKGSLPAVPRIGLDPAAIRDRFRLAAGSSP